MEWIDSTMVFGRSVRTLVIAAAILAGGVLAALVLRAVSIVLLRRRTRRLGDGAGGVTHSALNAIRNFGFPALVLAAVYGGVSAVQLEGTALSVARDTFVVLFSLLIIRFVVTLVDSFFTRTATVEGVLDVRKLRPLRSVSLFLVWVAGLLFLLANLGFDVSAVIAGLGIGGIAVALAAQAVLGDLFSYFVIIFDRPFELGDFIVIGKLMGTVEQIGVKSTRLRAASGEQVILSNSDLTGDRIHNYKRMAQRLVVFHLRVAYGTPASSLRKIPALVRKIIEGEEQTSFGRAHFSAYGEWDLSFEVVYTVTTPDYSAFMDIQQRINLAIYEGFEAQQIAFAVPAQIVRVTGPQGREPDVP